MLGVLTGFGIILIVVGAGFIAGRTGIVPLQAQPSLNRLAFYVFTPALLFTVMAEADLAELLGGQLLTALLSAVIVAGVYVLISTLFFRRPVADTTIGAAASSYVNANNIGLPVAVYVLGDAHHVAPLLLMQLLILAPIVLAVLDISTSGRRSFASFLRPFANPIIVASVLGIIVTSTGFQVPSVIMEAMGILGGAAVPLVLVAFGISLNGQRPLQAGSGRREVITATALKLALMPLVAFLIAHFVFGMTGHPLYVAVAIATLPTAQNIFNFASRYERGVLVARDTVLLTTILSIPVMLLVALLLSGA